MHGEAQIYKKQNETQSKIVKKFIYIFYSFPYDL